jgi:hypothetical protein
MLAVAAISFCFAFGVRYSISGPRKIDPTEAAGEATPGAPAPQQSGGGHSGHQSGSGSSDNSADGPSNSTTTNAH